MQKKALTKYEFNGWLLQQVSTRSQSVLLVSAFAEIRVSLRKSFSRMTLRRESAQK
jgi:hypothetical protein